VHNREGKKAPRLARPWPLLEDGQDPGSLQARVAYHLHRTGFVGVRLSASSFLSRPHLQALTQGRLPISAKDVARLAKRLGLPARQLLRPLEAHEAEAWGFYRTSARHRLYVWQRARACWQRAGINTRLAAGIMELRQQNLSQAFDDRPRGRVLAHEPALKLSTALNITTGPREFLMFAGEMLPPEHTVDDVVTPLSNAQVNVLKAQYLQAHSRHGRARR